LFVVEEVIVVGVSGAQTNTRLLCNTWFKTFHMCQRDKIYCVF